MRFLWLPLLNGIKTAKRRGNMSVNGYTFVSMLKILFVAALLPLIASAQSFEVSENAGYSYELSHVYNSQLLGSRGSGFSNQILVSYYISKRFSLGADYSINAWVPKNHSFNVVCDLHFNNFFLGANIGYFLSEKISRVSYKETVNPSLLYGLNIGYKQKIINHIFVNGKVIFCYSSATGSGYDFAFSNHTDIFYTGALIGVSYKL